MKITHKSAVTPEQIDHLGHMNVRFYGVNARAGSLALLAGLGQTAQDTRLDHIYTRHFTEQTVGAALEVHTAILDASTTRITIYHELYNVENSVLAASFVHGMAPTSPRFDRDIIDGLQADAITIPAYGAPRSISLDADLLGPAPCLDEAIDQGFAVRLPREISADECDSSGAHLDACLSSMSWLGQRCDGRESEPTLIDGPNGEKMGSAVMESRIVVNRRVRLGDSIQAFETVVRIADKATHRVQWVYDLDRRDLLHAQESVSVAFDTISRRAMSIPAATRAEDEKRLVPSYLPVPASAQGGDGVPLERPRPTDPEPRYPRLSA